MAEHKISIDSLELTQLEKDLYRLAMIKGRFHYIYTELPKMPEGETFYSVKSSIREYAVIQLQNFFDIRDSIRRDLKEINREIVDISLRPFWQPLYDQKEAIAQFRNEYYAHLQENRSTQFTKTMEQILYDSKFSGSWNDITYYAGCVLNYSKFMEINLQTEWYSAMGKYMLSNIANNIEVMFARDDIKHIQDVELELKKSLNLVIDNLKNNNLKYDIASFDKISFSHIQKNDNSIKSKSTSET